MTRAAFGAQLRPDAVRYSRDLSDAAKIASLVLTIYAAYEDVEYPTLARLQNLFDRGSRKRRFVFFWTTLYEKKTQPPKKPLASSGLENVASIVRVLA